MIKIDGKKIKLMQEISKSSVNYIIVSFLPPKQIIRLGMLNKRFYNLYVPVTLSNVTIGGTQPCSNSKQTTFALQFEDSKDLYTLDTRLNGCNDSYYCKNGDRK